MPASKGIWHGSVNRQAPVVRVPLKAPNGKDPATVTGNIVISRDRKPRSTRLKLGHVINRAMITPRAGVRNVTDRVAAITAMT